LKLAAGMSEDDGEVAAMVDFSQQIQLFEEKFNAGE